MDQSAAFPANPFRVFLWISVFAFFAGFAGYMAWNLSAAATSRGFAAAGSEAEFSPARLAPPQDQWVFEKAI